MRVPTPFGAFLRGRREARNLSGRFLADAMGISHVYFYQMENGEKLPTPDRLEQLTRALALTDEEASELYRRYVQERGVVTLDVRGVSEVKLRAAIAIQEVWAELDDKGCVLISEALP